MPPEKEIEPPKELEEQKPELINVIKQPTSDDNSITPTVLSPDELDAADKKAEQEANQLLAKAELQEVQDHGINNPDSDNPWFHPTTNSGHLFDNVFLNHKLIQSPNHRLRRIIIGIIIIGLFIGYFVYDQHVRNVQKQQFQNNLQQQLINNKPSSNKAP